ncbi:MAG: DMT family protein [Chitinophagaceae bacterium]
MQLYFQTITLLVFGLFAVLVMKETFHWRYLVSFSLLAGAAWFMFTKRFG